MIWQLKNHASAYFKIHYHLNENKPYIRIQCMIFRYNIWVKEKPTRLKYTSPGMVPKIETMIFNFVIFQNLVIQFKSIHYFFI